MSRTKRDGHYQSDDAELKEINIDGKKWTVGFSTNTQWQKVLRNLEKMESLRSKSLKDAGCKDKNILFDYILSSIWYCSHHHDGKVSPQSRRPLVLFDRYI